MKNPVVTIAITFCVLSFLLLHLVRAETQQEVESKRPLFSLPELTNFVKFKSLFSKHYNTIREDLYRRTIYIARAIRAYVSAVAYKYRKSDYYLSINPQSDWTAAELVKSESDYVPSLDNKVKVLTEADIPKAKDKKTPPTRRKRNILYDVQQPRSMFPSLNRFFENNQPFKRPPLRSEGLRDWPSESANNWMGPVKSFMGSFIEPAPYHAPLVEPDEVHVDHRLSNCFFPAQEQGKCGCCYAFAAIAFYEWAHCQETGRRMKLSEQYVVDCGPLVDGLSGCKGGVVAIANSFVNDYGLELERDYPYMGLNGNCPYNISSVRSTQMGYLRVNTEDVVSIPLHLIDEFLPYAPMVVNLATRGGFHEYGGGVHDGGNCGDRGTHSVLLVGSGREDGLEYWLFRNSHSPAYGLDGYYKMNKQAECIDPPLGFIYGSKDGVHVSLKGRRNLLRNPTVDVEIKQTQRYSVSA